MHNRSFVLFLSVALTATSAFGGESNPVEILKKSASVYKSMQTYLSEGNAIVEVDSGGVKTKMRTNFLITLKKPNSYLITWEQSSAAAPSVIQSGAVWSDGTQPYLFMGELKVYSKMSTDEMALGGAMGASGGAAFTVPSLFFTQPKGQSSAFERLVGLRLEVDEMIEGEDCSVISGTSAGSKHETVWISKTSHLIQKYSRSMDPPEDGIKLPKITDQQLEVAIKATGQEITKERIEELRKVMTQAEGAAKNVSVSGISIELYKKTATPQLTEKDFRFEVPSDAVLTEGAFGGLQIVKPPVTVLPSAPLAKLGPASKSEAGAVKALRTFSARNGKTVQAEYISVVDGTVKLRRKDGKVIDVPLDKFSDDDQDFIRSRGTK